MRIVTEIAWDTGAKDKEAAKQALHEALAKWLVPGKIFAHTPKGEPIFMGEFVAFLHDETKR
jgi:hypothetical protein